MWLIITGYQDRLREQRVQTRLMMFTMVSIWAEKGPKSPEELWALPGDETKETDEEFQKEILNRFSKLPKLNG